MLKRNLVANFLGQGVNAFIGIAFIPIYVRHLGIESYALIGIFAVIQASLLLLDMGMTPTIGREMARFKGGGRTVKSIRELLRSIEVVAFFVAVLISMLIFLTSHWVAANWVRADNLTNEVIANAFAMMGVVASLRFLQGIYKSCLRGLQLQVLSSGIEAVLGSIRAVGAVVVLAWISPTIQSFFIWQGAVSVVELCLYGTLSYRNLPPTVEKIRFKSSALREIGHYALGIIGITFLSLLLTQTDKFLLSKLLTLPEYGYFALASTVAGSVGLLCGPIVTALFPQLNQLHASKDFAGFAKVFHQGCQLVSVLLGTATAILFFFNETLVGLWTQDVLLAKRISELVSLYSIGNLLSCLMMIPYHAQLAYGWTSLTIKLNLVAVILLCPAIILATSIFGPIGAAWVWIGLNLAYVTIGVHFMFHRILQEEKWKWYINDLAFPLGGVFLVALFARFFIVRFDDSIPRLICVCILSPLILIAGALLAKEMRVFAIQNVSAKSHLS